MENKNIILLKHSPMNLKYTNSFYTNQVPEKDLKDYVVVDVTSRILRDKDFIKLHPTFGKDMSPFFIGPVNLADGSVANRFELFWQYSKVFPCHDDHGTPSPEFFKWRNKAFSLTGNIDKELMRHSNLSLGYTPGDTQYFAYYSDKDKKYIPLNYIDSRKKAYIPEYAKLVVNTPSFKWLQSLVDEGKKVALVDFDAYNFYYEDAMKKRYESYVNFCKKNKITPSLKESDFTNIKTISDAINSPILQAGHAFVLKLLLEKDIEVVDGKVIDNIGILNCDK